MRRTYLFFLCVKCMLLPLADNRSIIVKADIVETETKHVLEHDNVTLVCNGTEPAVLSDYFWIRNDTDGTTSQLFAEGPVLEFLAISTDDSGIYECRALDDTAGENVTVMAVKVEVETPTELTTAISGNEADFAIRLAQHLLSNLAVSSSYTIDGLYQPIARNTGKCPCNTQEPLKGTFGDTSFGCPEGWHGSPDIIIDHLTVKLAADLTEEDDDNTAGTSDTLEDSQRAGEVKVLDGFTEDEVCQMKAQTIVFSFLQKSKGEEMRHHLIPCIGINKRKVLIHFYDCVNDILLSSPPLDLYADMGNNVIDFNYPVILFLWLTLNYRLFCSGPTEEMKKYKSTFFTHVGDLIQIYEADVKRPCRVIDKRFEEKGSWANKRGKQGPHKEDTEIEYDEFTDDEDQDSGWF